MQQIHTANAQSFSMSLPQMLSFAESVRPSDRHIGENAIRQVGVDACDAAVRRSVSISLQNTAKRSPFRNSCRCSAALTRRTWELQLQPMFKGENPSRAEERKDLSHHASHSRDPAKTGIPAKLRFHLAEGECCVPRPTAQEPMKVIGHGGTRSGVAGGHQPSN
jgi:hypothetical protein